VKFGLLVMEDKAIRILLFRCHLYLKEGVVNTKFIYPVLFRAMFESHWFSGSGIGVKIVARLQTDCQKIIPLKVSAQVTLIVF
jgi:hypothetical protein